MNDIPARCARYTTDATSHITEAVSIRIQRQRTARVTRVVSRPRAQVVQPAPALTKMASSMKDIDEVTVGNAVKSPIRSPQLDTFCDPSALGERTPREPPPRP